MHRTCKRTQTLCLAILMAGLAIALFSNTANTQSRSSTGRASSPSGAMLPLPAPTPPPATPAPAPAPAIGTPAPQVPSVAPLSPALQPNILSGGGTPRQGTGGSSLALSPGSPSESAPSAPGGGGKTLSDCMGFWEPATHMSKQEWRAACKRTLNRIQ